MTSTCPGPEDCVCMCCFVLLTRYWVPRFLWVHRPQTIWGGRILTLHHNYVAGYTGPLLFLFERGKKKKEKENPKEKDPHCSQENCLTGIVTSLDSSGSSRLIPRVLSHEQDGPHNHNSRNCIRIVRERGRRVIQKMLWGKHNQKTIWKFYYARAQQQQQTPSCNMRDVVGRKRRIVREACRADCPVQAGSAVLERWPQVCCARSRLNY